MSQVDANTATVNLLTAKVRTLMVNNRQVTMSVYRQLDWVPLAEMIPFGRVGDPKQKAVIGRRAKDGSLVRSELHPGRNKRHVFFRSDEDLKDIWVIDKRSGSNIRAEVRLNGVIFYAYQPDYRYLTDDESELAGKGWFVDGDWDRCVEAMMRRLAAHVADVELHDAAIALPLVVLAGFR